MVQGFVDGIRLIVITLLCVADRKSEMGNFGNKPEKWNIQSWDGIHLVSQGRDLKD